jgi:hypothetical protein
MPKTDVPVRKNLFVIHSWDAADVYHRMKELLQQQESGLADYSVPPWKAIDGHEHDVEENIRHRISVASAVIVLNTPGLHRRPFSSFEMQVAVEQDKRLIVLQPHGRYEQPIPQALEGSIYYVSPWRSDVLGRAIKGEYAYQGKVFDIAERAERREVVQIIAGGVAFASIMVLVHDLVGLRSLQQELNDQGVRLQWTTDATLNVAGHALVGAAFTMLLTALLTEDAEATLWAGAAGALAGGTLATARIYRATLHGAAEQRALTLSASR